MYLNVKNDLITINSLATHPKYKNLNMSRYKLKQLEQENFITIIKKNNIAFVSMTEIKEYMEIKNNITENYVPLQKFIQEVFNINKIDPTDYKKAILQIKDELFIDFKIFRNREYVQKDNMLRFSKNFICREEVLKRLHLSLPNYLLILKKHNIIEFHITPKNSFLSISDFNTLKKLIPSISTLSEKSKWLIGAKIVKTKEYIHVAKKVETLIKIAKRGHFSYFLGNNNKLFIHEESFVNYAKLVKDLQENYYKLPQVTRLFEIKRFCRSQLQVNFIPNLFKLCEDLKIKYKQLDAPIEGEYIFIEKIGLNSFFQIYISNHKIIQQQKISYKTLNYWIEKENIPKLTLHYTLAYYLKQDIQKLFQNTPQLNFNNQSTDNDLGISNYYTLQEVKEILHANDTDLQQIRNEEGLSFLKYKGATLYLKEKINQLKDIQEEAKVKYCTPQFLRDKGYSPKTERNFKKYKVSYLVKLALKSKKRRSFVFLKSEVEAYINSDKVKKTISQLSYDKPSETFLMQINIYNLTFPTHCTFTKESWIDFCIEKLQFSHASKLTIEANVSTLIKCTRHLINSLGEQELYLKTAKEINLSLFNNQVPISHQIPIYSFLNHYYNKLKQLNLPLFNFRLINNPYKKEVVKKDKEIYTYEEYQSLFNYAIDIDLHKELAIDDAINKIRNYQQKKKTKPLSKHYASFWLYVLIHLNNAWRHNDICNFPEIDLDKLHVHSLKDFRNRNLTFHEGQEVINQIIVKDLIVSKTQITNQFFCSQDVTIALATAIIICQLIKNECFPLRNQIIDFGNKYQIISKSTQINFFKRYNNPKFIFENRKMNRTLLSFMYVLLVQKGDGGAALEIAQRLRVHKDFETTNIYIHIPEEELNQLSLQLFQRGHFGYIPNLFADILIGDTDNRDQRTYEITTLNKKFMDIYHIEASSAFINAVLSEKKLVADMILDMGQDSVKDYLFKLNANLLPSKENNIQCLISETGCLYNSKSCIHCVYAIPNFYALSALTDSISNLLTQFTKKFSSTSYAVERTKLANLLYMEMDLLNAACISFGQEAVLQFFKGQKEGYFDLLNSLDDLKTEKDIEEYLTYVPITQYE